jgi:hypothetical protein
MFSLTIISAAVYGFAAANTVPTSKAGDGAGVVSGYTVSNIHYNLNASNPRNIDSVTFNLDTAPVAGSTITIKLVSAGSTWYTCTNVAAAVTCNNGSTLGASVLTADELRVVVAD